MICNTIPDLLIQQVLNYVMFFDSIALAALPQPLFVLRHRLESPGDLRGFIKMIGYPWIPAIFIIVYTLVNVSVMGQSPSSLIGFVLLSRDYLSTWIEKIDRLIV